MDALSRVPATSAVTENNMDKNSAQKAGTAGRMLKLVVTTQETPFANISLAVNLLLLTVIIAMIFVTVWTRSGTYEVSTHDY